MADKTTLVAYFVQMITLMKICIYYLIQSGTQKMEGVSTSTRDRWKIGNYL